MIHELKILPKYFEDVSAGRKNFEIRRNDRDFKVGDVLVLKEYYRGKFTGKEVNRVVEYIYKGDGSYGLSEEFCILGLRVNPVIKYNVKGDNNVCIGYVKEMRL